MALAELIQRLVVDHLDILGDIYDRVLVPTQVLCRLNTIILWISSGEITIFSGWGAAAGQACCVATVVRICARYANLDILEDGYGT